MLHFLTPADVADMEYKRLFSTATCISANTDRDAVDIFPTATHRLVFGEESS